MRVTSNGRPCALVPVPKPFQVFPVPYAGLARDAVCGILRELKEIRVAPGLASGRIGIEAQVGRVKGLCLSKPHEQTGRIDRCRQEIVVHEEKHVWR